MNKLYMGLDVGVVMTKGILIDKYDNILASYAKYTRGDPIGTVKTVIKELRQMIKVDDYQVVSLGVTGSARKLVGTMLGANIIKNEITAEVVGTVKIYPDVKTIIDIGGYDAKLIIINDGVVTDYKISNLCGFSSGIYIDNLVREMDINIDDISFVGKNKIVNKHLTLSETEPLNKLQMGYHREDILREVCQVVANNYVNNLVKGKRIAAPIVFNGGVSKNVGVVKVLEETLNEKIIVSKNAHLMGAYGIALMAKETGRECAFDFNIDNYKLETKMLNCSKCTAHCEIVMVYRNDKLINYWGNQCRQENILKNV